MSIKNEAFKLCNTIWNSANREELQQVVNKLKSSTRGHPNLLSPTPILGLLLYDQHALKAFEGKSAVEELAGWDERELKLLFGMHNRVRLFNAQCLKPLMPRLAEAVEAINPYKEYPQKLSTEGFEELIFSDDDADRVAQSFHSHPAFDVALSTLSSIRERFDYVNALTQLDREIAQSGPGGEPSWISNFEQAEMLQHPHLESFRHIGALLSLHSSLSNLDQLIYQALFQDKLPQINRTQIIDCMWTTGGAGPSMWLMHIPFGLMYVFHVTDLIIVNTEKPEAKHGLGDTVCNIHSQTIPGTETGPGILKMRMLDDHLNSYRYLLRQ